MCLYLGNPCRPPPPWTVGGLWALTLPCGAVVQREQILLQSHSAFTLATSGGTLLNVRGVVVRMTTAIYTDAQRSSNIGIG